MSLEPAVPHLPGDSFQFGSFGPRKQGDAGAFNGGVAHLNDFFVGNVGNHSDAFGGFNVQMPAKSAGEIKQIHVVEGNVVVVKNHAEARDIGALGLGKFVDVAFGEINWRIAFHIQHKSVFAVFESAKSVHAIRAEQFA